MDKLKLAQTISEDEGEAEQDEAEQDEAEEGEEQLKKKAELKEQKEQRNVVDCVRIHRSMAEKRVLWRTCRLDSTFFTAGILNDSCREGPQEATSKRDVNEFGGGRWKEQSNDHSIGGGGNSSCSE